MPSPSRTSIHLALTAGVLAISTAAVLIRKCEAPPLVIAAYRLGLASMILVPLEAARRSPLPDRRTVGWCLLAGVFLSVHFAAWIASLSYTTVASSVVLVTTNPLFVALFSHTVLGERVRRQTAAGIVVGMAGAALIGWGDFGGGTHPLLGDALALAGALAASAYLLVGRKVRQTLPVGAYAAWVYGSSAAMLLGATAAFGLRLHPYPAATYGYLLLLALVPQVIGHTAINWSLAHLSAPAVAVVILGEPIGASVLAFLTLGEVPPASTLIGGTLILAGIALSLRGQEPRSHRGS